MSVGTLAGAVGLLKEKPMVNNYYEYRRQDFERRLQEKSMFSPTLLSKHY